MFLEKRVYQGSSGKVYPLPFTDRIAEKPSAHKWKAIWIENEFLRVLILPEIGGRIHALLDKTNGYDLIYNQPVIKPALVGLAGPWISGGIEFNWPQHHRPATFLPVDTWTERHPDGSITVWCSDLDPLCRMKGMHGVCLHPERAYLEVKARAYNRTPFVQTFLWWANVATRVHEAYQSFFPPDVDHVADHARRSMSTYPRAEGFYYGVNYGQRGRKGIPPDEVPAQYVPPHCRQNGDLRTVASGVPGYAPNDLSFYANIPVPTSYMCMGSREDFFGGYDHQAEAGIVHFADHHIAPGKKQWTWGNHEFGYAWDRNLTEATPDGEFPPYIEIMAGVYTDNQPDFSFLQPGETKSWSQYWYPIQKIGPAQHANLDAAVSLALRPGNFSLGVVVTRILSKAVVRLERADGSAGAEWDADLAPGKPFVLQSPQARKPWTTGETVVRVLDRHGQEIIAYRPKPRATSKVPPSATEPPAPLDITSADELFVTGLHLDQYRHATRCPTLYWREALRRDPLDSRCNNAMGRWHLKRGEFKAAEAHFRQAIQRLTRRNANPYDGEPYYHLGLCLRFQDRDAEAYDALYKATWNQAWAAASRHALAEIDCCRGNWDRALDHLQQSLRLNGENLRARNLKAVVLSRLQRPEESRVLVRRTLALDPLDWWARHLREDEPACDTQTLLDIALDYARAGFWSEAIGLIEQGERARRRRSVPRPAARRAQLPADQRPLGTAPLVHYYLGWLHERLARPTVHEPQDTFMLHMQHKGVRGRRAARHARLAGDHYRRAAAAPPDYCFPSRLEEIAILEAAMAANPRDARAPYYLGNLLYDRRRHEDAIRLWERSAELDPAFSIVWRNLGIGYFNILRQPARARLAYDRAFQANPADARLLYERDQLWKRLGEAPARRLRELEKRLDLVRRRDDLSVELCSLYNQTSQHAKALELVGSRHFQPWEGGEGGPLGQWVRSHLALGRAALAAGQSARAREHFEAALTAPRNLGEAKHLLANQSDIHYWLGRACESLGDKASARQHWLVAATFQGDFQEMRVRAFSEMTYFSARSWARLGQHAKAAQLSNALLAYARQVRPADAKVDYFATSLPAMLLFDDDLQFREATTALFLQAQAQLGLGRKGRARTLLRRVLQRDPNHASAADLLAEPGD